MGVRTNCDYESEALTPTSESGSPSLSRSSSVIRCSANANSSTKIRCRPSARKSRSKFCCWSNRSGLEKCLIIALLTALIVIVLLAAFLLGAASDKAKYYFDRRINTGWHGHKKTSEKSTPLPFLPKHQTK